VSGPGGQRGIRRWLRRLRRRLYGLYYHLKFAPFARERRGRRLTDLDPQTRSRGFVAIQIDALAHEDLERALAAGYMPTLRRLLEREGWQIRRFGAGLPSATPAAQAAIFHGTKDRIPAFRFYEKEARRVIIGSQPASMQFIRDRLPDDGVLRGGSSYVNLYDGGASRSAFTLSQADPSPFFQKMGGGRLTLLLLLHPLRVLRIILLSILEYAREEKDRLLSQIRGTSTYYWWYLPFLHIGSNVVLREIQTLAVLLDVYTGMPAIYTTYNVYDEFAHHFGPSSRTALKSLRALDENIRQILTMVRRLPGRPYDVYILSDHGQTPSVPYRVVYGETLGDTIVAAAQRGVYTLASTGDYGPVEETVGFLLKEIEEVASTSSAPARSLGLRLGRWIRRQYQIFPLTAEVVRIAEEDQLVVTYSSSLAHVYWTDPETPLGFDDIRGHPERRALYYFLVSHDGIGVVITRMLDGAHVEGLRGRALVSPNGEYEVLSGEDPLPPYAPGILERKALVHLAQLPNSGDLVLFGTYDPHKDLCICFDDQVGAHGALGGRQFWPFLMTPPAVVPPDYRVHDPLDLHPLFRRYTVQVPLARPPRP
jgi:hypothetical protein